MKDPVPSYPLHIMVAPKAFLDYIDDNGKTFINRLGEAVAIRRFGVFNRLFLVGSKNDNQILALVGIQLEGKM